MANEDDFIDHLLGFGLTEKEAHCYFYLLKYGPKTPSPLAKSLHTYREDVHRTLQSLIDKGMTRPSLDSPTLYAAVDLEPALESALKKHESELREMEAKKRELKELSRQQRFRPSDEVSTFKIIKSVKELVSNATTLLASAGNRFVYVVPAEMLAIAEIFGINDAQAKLITEPKGYVRGISDISYADIAYAQACIDVGDDLRHFSNYTGLYFAVLDQKHCVSAINVDINRISLNEPISVLWTDDMTYAQYLTSTFELLWERSVPAEERIRELSKEGPPKTD